MKALLIIDVQNDYFPNGKLELDGSIKAVEKIRKMIDKFHTEKLPIIYIRHIAKNKNATFFIEGTNGTEIYEEIKPEQDDIIIEKHYPNSFRETELKKICEAKGIDTLVIVGMMTHMCVDTTTRAAKDLGFDCILISDCCATKDLAYKDQIIRAKDVQHSFLAALNGTFAQVIDSNDCLKLD
jgi:nicotinamidase-related amidase